MYQYDRLLLEYEANNLEISGVINHVTSVFPGA